MFGITGKVLSCRIGISTVIQLYKFPSITFDLNFFRVPPNSMLFGGTVPPNSVLFGGTVLPNCVLFGGTVPPNSFFHN